MLLKDLENLKKEKIKIIETYVKKRKEVGKINDIFFKKYNVEKKYDAEIRNHGADSLIICLEHAKIYITLENNLIKYDFNILKSNYIGFEGMEEGIKKKKYMINVAKKVNLQAYLYLKEKHKELVKKEKEIYLIQESKTNEIEKKITEMSEFLVYKMLTRNINIEEELIKLLNSGSGIQKTSLNIVNGRVYFKEIKLNIEKRNGRNIYIADDRQDTKRRIVNTLKNTLFVGNKELKKLKDLSFYEALEEKPTRVKGKIIIYADIDIEDLLLNLKSAIETTLKVEEF